MKLLKVHAKNKTETTSCVDWSI